MQDLIYKNGLFKLDSLSSDTLMQIEVLFNEYFETSMTPEINKMINEKQIPVIGVK